MTIKKMLLLLSAMAASAAFAAPAAHAEVWWTSDGNTEEGTTLEGLTNVTGSGSITSTSSSGFVWGPCEITASGTIINGSEMGEGSIPSFTIKTPCATNVPGCTVATAHNSATAPNPWPVTLTTTDTVDITNVTFTHTYSGASCAAAGVPPAVSITGTVTGTVENISTPNGTMAVRVNLNNHTDHLTVENPATGQHVVPAITVNLTGTFFTLERAGGLDLTFEHKE